ncbi:hypothetical protein KW803_01465 [Candidatus Saccharibacteria bacterium]|nr:hypothetical protein [Candidatus Saccharibacteria bacterium]
MALLRRKNNSETRGTKSYKRTQLNTYYKSTKEPAETSPFKKKQTKRSHRKILFGATDIILVALLLAGLVYSLVLKPQPKIIASDSSYHSRDVYRSQITPLFNGVGNRNKISFSETSVIEAIQKKFPEVQSARVELPFFSQEPKVWLNISPPAFRLVSSNQAYIVDTQGVAVAKAEDITNVKGLATLDDQSGFDNKVGSQVLSSQAVAFIDTVIAQTKKAKVPISTLTLPPLAQELDLRTADQPYYVKFYLGGDALTQSGQLLASRQKFSQTKQVPSQYLDVRVQGKIFYK